MSASAEGEGGGNAALAAAFRAAAGEGRAALIPFVTAGDPSAAATIEIVEALAVAGADVVELGIPFSDPVADGPAIQRSSQRALAAGFRTPMVFDIVSALRQRGVAVPIVLFTYVNPILALGPALFAKRAAAAGANAVLAVDLPLEESESLRATLSANGLDLIPLVAPTTAPGRLEALARAATGFVYLVSMLGVTGQSLAAVEPVAVRVAELRRITRVPVAVGFGVRTADDVRRVAKAADAVVVGSEMVRRIADAGAEGVAAAAGAFVRELRQATQRD